MRVLITGANGFVGPHLIEHLRTTTAPEHIAGLVWDVGTGVNPPPDLDQVATVDLREATAVAATVADLAPDVVFHLAAVSSVAQSWQSPTATFAVNVGGTANLLAAADRLATPPLVIVPTSGEVYGPTRPGRPAREEDPLRPASPYALSKATQDQTSADRTRPPVVRLRPFPHTGPGQTDRFALPSFARQIAEIEAGLRPPQIAVGNLDAVRDIGDVRDVVRAYCMVAAAEHVGQVYNVATGAGHRLGDLLEQLCGLARCPVTVRHDPSRDRPLDVPELIGDAARLTAATGWQPRIPLATTLADLLAWWRGRITGAS